jgi:hypothetical protein
MKDYHQSQGHLPFQRLKELRLRFMCENQEMTDSLVLVVCDLRIFQHFPTQPNQTQFEQAPRLLAFAN